MAKILDINALGSPAWDQLDFETWDNIPETDTWDTFGEEFSVPNFVFSEFQIHSPALVGPNLDADARRKSPVSFGPFQKFIPGNYTYEKCLVKLSAETEQTSETLPEFTKLIHYVYTPTN